MTEPAHESQPADPSLSSDEEQIDASPLHFFKIRFREQGQEFTAGTKVSDLKRGDLVMVRTDHGPEPATIINRTAGPFPPGAPRPVSFQILGRVPAETQLQYQLLPQQEQEAHRLCRSHIERLHLSMRLVRVDRYFTGSKIIF